MVQTITMRQLFLKKVFERRWGKNIVLFKKYNNE